MLEWIETHIPAWVFLAFIIHGTVLGTVAYLILLERKIASWVQDRIGPNRVGLGFGIIPFLKDFHFWGLGQPLADGLKFIVKEDYRPKGVDKILFTVAPGLMILVIIISIAVIPWGGIKQGSKIITVAGTQTVDQAVNEQKPAGTTLVDKPKAQGGNSYLITYRWPFQIADLNIGVLFVLATLSLAVYGVVVGGWASNNKYSFLGALRATANMISYEIPLGLAVLCIVLMFGTLSLGDLVEKQAHYIFGVIPAWNVFTQPLTFLMFLICIHAEANRAPFDLAEAEQELVGGYHTEYSSMRFALFFLAEYAGMITTSAVCVALFFGGWHFPWIDLIPVVDRLRPVANHPAITTSLLVCIFRAIVFFSKTIGIIFIFMWVRWSLPRFRFDQLMMLAWRSLIPMSLALLATTAVVIFFFGGGRTPELVVTNKLAVALLAGNIAVGAASLLISRLIPPAPETNRRVTVSNSRFTQTPLPKAAVPISLN